MIKAKELLNKMVAHLSDWLIIRRNPLDTAGGKILLGVAEEVTEIEDAIEEYVESHFISNYINKTHVIDSEYMRIHVGAIEINHLKITSPILDVINNMQTFAESAISCNYALLHDNYVYFKPYHVAEGEKVQYSVYGVFQESVAERVPIWNIYDEFALYVGLERLDRENNKHLLERILYQAQNPVNSSEIGIQNAIANLTGLQPKEIKVEKLDESNYMQNDFTGENLFEQLVTINRDIYRSKRWGVDYWQHDTNYVSYFPHEYDVNPGYYQNGIGDNNDLKVGMTRKNEIVHMEVKGYAQNENTIEEYYKKYPVEVTTKLKLFKPQNTINPLEVNALIEAGTLTEVTNCPMVLTYKAIRTVSDHVRLNKIIDVSKLSVVKNTFNFVQGHKYEFRVRSKKAYGSFNAQITHNNKSLITGQENFYLDDFNWLTHKNIKFYANQLSYFSEYNRFNHEPNGFKLKPQFTSGQLRLPLKNFENQKITWDIFMPEFDVMPDNAFSYKNFIKEQSENAYASKLNTDALFAIRQTANKIKFYVEGSAVILVKTALGDYESKIENGYFETSDVSLDPKDYLIHIIPSSSNNVIKIKELQYIQFEIEASLIKGKIEQDTLPNFEDNELVINIKTETTTSPTIGYIYIGDSLDGIIYISQAFTYKKGDVVDFKGADVVFEITDLTNYTIMECEQNTPEYGSLSPQELKINLSAYKTVDQITPYDGGHILNKKGEYYLKLEAGETCSCLSIRGDMIDFTKQFSLSDIVEQKSKARYYISPIVEGFIETMDYDMRIITPTFDYRYGEFNVANYEPFTPIFKTSKSTSYLSSCTAPINLFYLKAPVEKHYKAYNRQYLYESSTKNVAVNKNFDPILPYNEKLFFKVTSLTDKANVYFYNKEKEAVQNEGYESMYSVDLKPLNYYTDFSLNECLNHITEEVELKIKLNKRILLPDYVTTPLGNDLDLREYLITPEEGMSVYYTSPQEEDIALDPTYIQTEKFTLESDSFKKLRFCHLYKVIYCSFKPFTENASSDISSNYYTLIKELGVIQFTSYFTQQNLGRTIYVHYAIEKPNMLILDTDKLYNIVPVTHEAYRSLFTTQLTAPIGELKYDDELFLISDYTTVAITEPGYLATALPKEKKIVIIETGARDRIAIHKGFYYFNQDEYYLFGANSDNYEEYKNDHVEAYNAIYMEDGMIFQSSSENLIRNSMFNCTKKARLFSTDFSELKSINYFKRFNACEQINLWDHHNMKLEIENGLYGKGISFDPIETDATHFIGLPIDQTGDDITISFWLKGNAVPIIYVQQRWQDEMHLTLSRPKKTINFSNKGYIHYASLPYDPDCFYYLYITGSGVIDDIVLCKTEQYDTSLHEKNINLLIMPQFEAIESPYQRLIFSKQKGYTGTAQMLDDGLIVPSATLSYAFTPLLSKDWMQYAEIHNAIYKDNCVIPISNGAYIKTPILKLDNKDFIKEVIVKPNFLSEEVIPLIVYMGSSEKSLRPVNSTASDVMELLKVEDYVQVECNLKNALYSLDVSVKYIEGAISESYRENVFESELFDLGSVSAYELEALHFKIYGNAKVYIRAGKISSLLDNYKALSLSDTGKLLENFQLGDIRYLQFKITFSESCNLEYFDIKNTEA